MVRAGYGALIAVYMVVFVDFMQLSFLFPLLPEVVQFLLPNTEHPGFYVGLIGCVASIAEGIASPFLGQLADKIGRRPVFITAITGCGFCCILSGVAPRIDYWLLVAARFLAGGFGGTASIAAAYISDVTEPEERGSYMTYFQAALFAGLAFGPAIGAMINFFFDFEIVCFCAAGVCFLNLLLVIFLMPESLSQEQRQAMKDEAAEIGIGSLPSAAYPIFIANFFNGIGFTAFEALGELFAQRMFFPNEPDDDQDQKNAHTEAATNFWSVAIIGVGVFGLIVNLFLYNRFLPCMGLKGTVAFGGLFSVTSFFCIGIPISKWWFFVWIQVFVFGENIMGTSVQTIITRVVHPSQFGKALGLMTLCQNVARGIGPLVLPTLFDCNWGTTWRIQWSASIPWFANCVFKAVAVVLCLSVKYLVQTQPSPDAEEGPDRASMLEQAQASFDAIDRQIARSVSSAFRAGGLMNLVSNQASYSDADAVVPTSRAMSSGAVPGSEVGASLALAGVGGGPPPRVRSI